MGLRPLTFRMIRFPLLASAMLLAQPLPAAADSSASLAGCRAIGADSERLACYDRLAEHTPTAATLIAPRVTAPQLLSSAPVTNAASETGDSFGAEVVRKLKSAEPRILKARVIGYVDSVSRDQILLLDNGQRWRVLSDKDFDYTADQPAATIERNLIGTYWMRLGDQGPAFKVRRVQ